MGLCKTSNFSIFTFINGSDLKFCTRSHSSCVYLMMRFKGSNGKVCKMMTSHFRTLLVVPTIVQHAARYIFRYSKIRLPRKDWNRVVSFGVRVSG